MKYLILLVFSLIIFPLAVQADCVINQSGEVVCGEGQCSPDQYGQVRCAKAGGGAIKDVYGNVQCGIGYCASDDQGTVWCSRVPGGSSEKDPNGKVKCFGECMLGSTAFCQ